MWVSASRLQIVISGVLCRNKVCFEVYYTKNRPLMGFVAFQTLLLHEFADYFPVSALATSYFTGIDIAI